MWLITHTAPPPVSLQQHPTFVPWFSVSLPCWITSASSRSFLYAFSITWGGEGAQGFQGAMMG